LQAVAERITEAITAVIPKQKFKLMIIVAAKKRNLKERRPKKKNTKRPAVANEDQEKMQKWGGCLWIWVGCRRKQIKSPQVGK